MVRFSVELNFSNILSEFKFLMLDSLYRLLIPLHKDVSKVLQTLIFYIQQKFANVLIFKPNFDLGKPWRVIFLLTGIFSHFR